ncbi:MAG: LysR family transcriptional regulator [Nitrospirae bacterium]|nr:MAG: LysR family transcriptional regulator [Nitrospirota bacterium]
MHKKNGRSPEKTSSGGLKGRIWIDGAEGTFLGYGRIVLLERIKEYGSITQAAKSMKMSYRRAWELVESMNSQSPKRLVEASTGGKGGGGAVLTDAGEDAVKLFWRFYDNFQKFLKREGGKLSFDKKSCYVKNLKQKNGGSYV